MTIAVISSRFPFSGETFLGTELRGLRRHFDRVIVVPARDALYSRVTLIEAYRAVRKDPRRFLRALRTIVRGSKRPSVLFKNLLIFPKALAVARMLEREGVDHVHAYWLSTPATVAFVAAEMTGIPWSASAHLWDIYENNLIRHKARSARFIRAISDRGAADLTEYVERCDAAKVRKVVVGVELPSVSERKASKVLRIVCAANLVEKKGHADLLAALKMLADAEVEFRCDIAGSGPLHRRLQRRITELALQERVFMLGRLEHRSLLDRLARGDYDVKVLASLDEGGGRKEGIPVALMEAMAAGLPCVATDSGSVPELLDGTSGFVVPAGNARRFAEAIERLAKSTELRFQLGCNARRRVERDFNLERTGPALAELIATA